MRLFLMMALCGCAWFLRAGEAVGRRPYEMDWANRTQDDHPPLIDFENLEGWRVECKEASATFTASREQQLWGQYVGKLAYRGTGKSPSIRILPPAPVRIAQPFDAVTLWLYGNNWGYSRDTSTPPIHLELLFLDAKEKPFSVSLSSVHWKEWFLLHRRLEPAEIERVKGGAKFAGMVVTGGKNEKERVVYFDNLAVFTEIFAPLPWEPRPERGIAMFPGQLSAANVGEGKLPFPTRNETILPSNLTEHFQTSLKAQGSAWVFTYAGEDGELAYTYEPRTGTWSDVRARWSGKGSAAQTFDFRPCAEGGVYVNAGQGPVLPEKAEHLGTQPKGDTVESRWQLSAGGNTVEVIYTFRLWNKSLVLDVRALGGQVGEVRFGRAEGLSNAKLVTNPFYPAAEGRPAVVVAEKGGSVLFVTGNTDWYLSNGSIMWARNEVATNGVVYNGGTRYLPKTDGQRNDCFERFFVTVSPRYEEVLPNIPNPVSPWKNITGTRLWRAHGAGNRTNDARYWRQVHRYGMTQMVVTDHETGWRDGGESFTFRTRPAPGKGGDQGQYDYARLMQDELGFVYGPYNNFTDFAPVNEYWSTDMISRGSDKQLQRAWARCYAPKPARAVEYCAKLAPIIQEKFKFSTAYCDVHTCVAPWSRVDYDARAPGAGIFSAVFYSYGEIMLLQKKAWNGPVYSEGSHHAFYCGLTDGNYGQDQRYRLDVNPWLVDFDLRKMHDLCCNFGLGNPGMFYGKEDSYEYAAKDRDAWLDRFLAGTVAFGHPGFLVMEGGMDNALRSYYMLQQLHSRYCLTNAQEIRYADASGKLLATSEAVATGAYQRSQVVVRYADGTVVAANGNLAERMRAEAFGRKVDLPPNGYCGWTSDGAVEVSSADREELRRDYSASPAYLYADGRGRFARFAKAASDKPGICRILGGEKFEIIPYKNAECGFAITPSAAVALDEQRKELGSAQWRTARGLAYVQPVKGAFSYAVTGKPEAPRAVLACARDEVVAGEEVVIQGKEKHVTKIPADAKPGQRVWLEFEGAAIDFTVVPLAHATVALEGEVLKVAFTSHLGQNANFTVRVGDREKFNAVAPGELTTFDFPLDRPQGESAKPKEIEIRVGSLRMGLASRLRATLRTNELAKLPAYVGGIGLRAKAETRDMTGSGAQVTWRSIKSGEVAHTGIFMHPPYKAGTGYAFALYEPLTLPANAPAAFRALNGKGDGSALGDGILFQVAVVDAQDAATVVAQHVVTNHAWHPIEADLSRWAGQTIRLKLMSDVGAQDNSSGDWAGWAQMRVAALKPQWGWQLEKLEE